jgi:hypothetical protein
VQAAVAAVAAVVTIAYVAAKQFGLVRIGILAYLDAAQVAIACSPHRYHHQVTVVKSNGEFA